MHFIQRADEESGVQPMIAMLRSKYTFVASLHFANFTVVVCDATELKTVVHAFSLALSACVRTMYKSTWHERTHTHSHTFACRSTWQAPESMENRCQHPVHLCCNLVCTQTNKRFQWNAINFLLLQWSFCKIPFCFFLSVWLSCCCYSYILCTRNKEKNGMHLHSTQISTQLRM